MPLLALGGPRRVWQPGGREAGTSLACRRPLGLCAAQGQRRLKVVSACLSESARAGRFGGEAGESETWIGIGREVREGAREGKREGGAQSAPLAFTDSLRIAKFFSNLQLLDVGANHQRGSPRAYPPSPPLSTTPPTTTQPQTPILSPSRVPSHSGLFTYSCVYLLFHRLRLCRIGEASPCVNGH